MTTESTTPGAAPRPSRMRFLVTGVVLLAAALAATSADPVPAGAHVLTGPPLAHVLTGRPTTSPAAARGAAHVMASASAASPGSGPAFGSYSWPVRGPVVRPFEPPATQYSAGHRGIDIAVPLGTPIRAPADGTVAFAGAIAGSLFISIDHPGGIRTSYSWVSAVGVKWGQAVTRGEIIGRTGPGDPGSAQPILHFGARLNDVYIDPMLLLGGGNLDEVIHLAPRG
jgi:murein DD-endopeptidase MepM/ murein hydrolase activator NlpD